MLSREENVENSSPMSFKLPINVINKYKNNLSKKTSFKRSLTEEIKNMCDFIEKINDHNLILKQISKLEKETSVNKRYVVTDVDTESSSILKDFRNKFDVTQSALLWLWLENNGEIVKSVPVEKKKKMNNIKTVPITKVEKGSINIEENDESEIKYVGTNLSTSSSSNINKIEKLMKITEYQGPTEELEIELPSSTLERFKSSVPKNTPIEKAMQDEIRKLCKIVKLSKTKSIIVNHVKRIERYKTDKMSMVIKVDPESMQVLNQLNNSYGISKSGLIWLWLSIDSLKYNMFKLVD